MHRDEVFAALDQHGYTHAVLTFYGGGDEGDVEEIELKRADLPDGTPVASDKFYPGEGGPLPADVVDALCQTVYDNFEFNGENGVHGTVEWVARDRRVTADYNQQAYTHYVKTLTT